MSDRIVQETLTHRLILPKEANHHGTLYAGAMLTLALEAGYATAYRSIGGAANLVLKRVLDLRCLEPVPIGHVVEVRGLEVYRARAQVVVGLIGTPLVGHSKPWMDGLMQFVQVDEAGSPEPIPAVPGGVAPVEPLGPWAALGERARKLLAIRG